MVVPPPIAEPWTAATSGLSKLTTAFIKRAWGVSPDPGGLFRKSTTSLPAQNESPAPCQSTTRTCSSDRKSTRLNSSHTVISYAVFCLKKKKKKKKDNRKTREENSKA